MPEKVALISLGCPKNLVDSEMMLGQLQSSGYELTADAADADVIVVNTCGFLQAAAQESVDALLAAAQRKKNGKCRAVIAAGCMTQRFGADAPEALPEVDGFLGVGQVHELPSVVDRALGGHRESRLRGPAAGFEGYGLRIRATPTWTAYVKVSEGCDRKCAFCVIPQIRGPMVSRPMEAIVAEAESLAADGTGEIILIGQDPNRYGVDLGRDLVQLDGGGADAGSLLHPSVATLPVAYGASVATLPVAYAAPSTLRVAPSPHPPLASLGRVPGPVAPSLLATLLRRLDGIESLRWIRLMYLFPDRSLEPLIDVLAESSRICRYLDIPFQHASPEIVRAMNRPGGAEMYLDFIARVREAVPDVSLRSTFIVGFPGETERHFEELLAFVRAAQLDWVGVFQYSREEGAPAATLRARVPRRVAQERYDRLMQLQQEITATRNQRWLGRTLDVLVEEVSETEAIGRHEGQAPEIDGVVRIELSGLPATDRPVPGQWIPARVTDIDHYDLIAKSQ